MIKKIVITAAGTGGHIVPGLAVARLFRQQGVEVLWIGGRRPLERTMVEGEDFLFESIDFHSFRTGSICPTFSIDFNARHGKRQRLQILPVRKLWISIDSKRKSSPSTIVLSNGRRPPIHKTSTPC
jgi:UDP-N-acetylglucosamine--N-acetylmuramyl-(pentapeptide) pyrophosphoryl-undecaprenol N-acetylglucosamine transferase